MARPSTVIVIFFVTMNVFAGVIIGLGVDSTMGLDGSIHQQKDVANQEDFDIDTGTGTGSTLFGMYNVVLKQFTGLLESVFPAIQLLGNAGMPAELITGATTLLGTIAFIDGLAYVRGFSL